MIYINKGKIGKNLCISVIGYDEESFFIYKYKLFKIVNIE